MDTSATRYVSKPADLDDDDVRIGDVKVEENMLGELREQLE